MTIMSVAASRVTIDPIHAVIEAATAAFSRFVQHDQIDEDEWQALCDTACDCHMSVVDTHPTTLPGVVAKADYIGPLHSEGQFNESETSSLEYLRNDIAYLSGLPLVAPSNRLNWIDAQQPTA